MTTAETTISYRLIGRRSKEISLALSRDFDSRWIGELPLVFDGSPAECSAYAEQRGYVWIPDDNALFGGRWEHPTEPNILYPV